MKIATVCSGIGSPELAVENLSKELGFEYENVFACEIDKFARASYNAIHSCGTMYEDMTREQWDQPGQYADLFIGGIPCQAFSLAGKRLGEKDKRGVLFYDFYRYVKNQQPKVFIIENVKGLLSDNKGRTFKNWCSLLGQTVNYAHNFFKHPDCLDYHLHYMVLNTKDFGLPQNRERVFLVGIRQDLGFEFEFPNGWPLTKRLKDIQETNVHERYYLSEKAFKFITNPIRLQKKFTQVNGTIALTLTAKGQTNWTGDFIVDTDKLILKGGIKDGKLKIGGSTKDYSQGQRIYDEYGISATLNAQGGGQGAKTGLYQVGSRIRRLTPLECWRLQGFPDDLLNTAKMVNSEAQLYKQAGNSISVPVIQAIIKNLLPILNK